MNVGLKYLPQTKVLVCLLVLAAAAAASHANAGPKPLVAFDQSSATGPIVRHPGHTIEIITIEIRDSIPTGPARDTIPALARIDFRWHAAGSHVVGYRYRLDEPGFVTVDSSVTAVSYNTGSPEDAVTPGRKVFRLIATDYGGNEHEITRYFQMNYAPDTWFAGPDTTALDARFGWSGHERYLDVGDWMSLPDLSGSLLSCDSLTVRPNDRAARKTFFEIYGDRLYVRAENDTVHMNSMIIVHGGGSDLDSPYHVRVAANDPALEDTAACYGAGEPLVIRPAGLIGSPIGFQYSYLARLDPDFVIVNQTLSGLFPIFEPAAVDRNPKIGAYTGASYSGKMYYLMRAMDGHGASDRSVSSATARTIADHVDAGIGTPEENALRPKILTFYVNLSPFLLLDDPAFVPESNQPFATRTLELNLLADDADPFDPAAGTPHGGPSDTGVLRWNVTLKGRDADGLPVSHSPLAEPVFTPRIVVNVPDNFVDSLVTIEVELCDCNQCEFLSGTGRCVTYEIPVRVYSGTTAVDVHSEARFAIESVRPNPAIGEDLTVHYSLARSDRARLEIIDVTGRRQFARELGSPGPGRHAIRLGSDVRLAPGVYVVRLVQGRDIRAARVAVLK